MREQFEQYWTEKGVAEKNNATINEAFEYRKKYIPEIGKQLEEKRELEIKIGDETLKVDYRILTVGETLNEKSDPVVLLSGYGSGWEGIAELGFSLAAEGRKVVLLSLPGYGNSSNPSQKYFDAEGFHNEAAVVKETIRQLRESVDIEGSKRLHLVGHSVGSAILSEFAASYPDESASLTLLNPAGLTEPEHPAKVGGRFVAAGVQSAVEYQWRMARSGEKDYEQKLYDHIPKFESPFSQARLAQRYAEMHKVAQVDITKSLKKTECPKIFISGGLDVVYPPEEQAQKLIQAVDEKLLVGKSIMNGLRHNTTLAPDEVTAANISHYLDEIEKSREEADANAVIPGSSPSTR